MPLRIRRAPRALHTCLGLLLSLAALGCGGASAGSGESTTAGVGSASATLPSSFNPGQGETAYGVYLAIVRDGDEAEIARLMAEFEARGVTGGGSGQLGCDQGAAAVLGADDDDTAVSVAFRTRAEADQFVAAWGSPVLGVAEFVAYCRD